MTVPGIFKSKILAPDILRLLWLWTAISIAAFGRTFYEIYRPAEGGRDVKNHILGRDFLNVWLGAKLTIGWETAKVYSVPDYMAEVHRLFGQDYTQHNFSYPPHILPLILVFGLLAYFPALTLWLAAGVASLTAALRRHAGWPVLFLVLLSPASLANLASGQNGLFTAALFLGGLFLCETSPLIAGILFGLLTFKPHLGILIPFVLLLRGNWKCIASASGTTVFLVAVSFLAWGITPWNDYLKNIVPYQAHLLEGGTSLYHRMMPGVFSDFSALFRGYDCVAFALYAVAALAAFAGALMAVRKEGLTARTIFMLSLATLIVLPYGFNYDMIAVSGALAVYLVGVSEVPVLAHLAFGVLWALPLAMYEVKKVPEMPVCSMTLLAAFAFLYMQVRRQAQNPRVPA
ncbi:MAG: glycosyltransferase family 87 protein [Alphaproteobacteria bacterium]